MKRVFFVLLLAVLALNLLPVGALASYDHSQYHGDLVIKTAKAYLDPEMKDYLGKIPKYTAVVVKDMINDVYYTMSEVSLVEYRGVPCYIKTSCLLKDEYPASCLSMKLKKGVRVYQRPSASSSYVKTKSKKNILYFGTKGHWALIRTDALDGMGDYGFVYVK